MDDNKRSLQYKRIKSILYKMHDRCENPQNINYQYYGEKGIKVCDEWKYDENGINNFVEWSISNGYDSNLEIDRKDNNGNYCPQNCRWVTHKINCNNKSDNRNVDYNGVRYTVSELAEKFEINKNTIIERLNKNIDPVNYKKDYQYLKRKVYQFTKDKQLVAEYESIKECAKKLDTYEVCISRVCNGYRKTHKGFIFSFNKEEQEND